MNSRRLVAVGAGEFEDPPRRLHIPIESGERLIRHSVEMALGRGVDDEREIAFGIWEAAGVAFYEFEGAMSGERTAAFLQRLPGCA